MFSHVFSFIDEGLSPSMEILRQAAVTISTHYTPYLSAVYTASRSSIVPHNYLSEAQWKRIRGKVVVVWKLVWLRYLARGWIGLNNAHGDSHTDTELADRWLVQASTQTSYCTQSRFFCICSFSSMQVNTGWRFSNGYWKIWDANCKRVEWKLKA